MLSALLDLEAPSAASYAVGAMVMLAGVVAPLFYMYSKNRGAARSRHGS